MQHYSPSFAIRQALLSVCLLHGLQLELSILSHDFLHERLVVGSFDLVHAVFAHVPLVVDLFLQLLCILSMQLLASRLVLSLPLVELWLFLTFSVFLPHDSLFIELSPFFFLASGSFLNLLLQRSADFQLALLGSLPLHCVLLA